MNKDAQVRVGVVGCGAIGQAHIGVWAGVERARVTAVCDAVPGRAEETARAIGAAAFTDVAAMTESGTVDAVDVCTPSGLHARQGLEAARRGLHVLCEKPLDIDLRAATELVEACEARGVVLACVLQRRAYRGAAAVTDAIRRGDLGEMISCCAYVKWWRDQCYYDSSGWRGTLALDGGVLANQGIHALDHLCWVAGRIVGVEHAYAATLSHRMEAEDFLMATVRFESGARGVIEATTCCNPPLCSRVEIIGSRGAAAFDDASVVQFGYGGADLTDTVREHQAHLGGRAEAMAISMRGHDAILRDFAWAVLDGRAPIVSGRDALASVEALTAVYRAAGVFS